MICSICNSRLSANYIDLGYCSEPICSECLSQYMRLDDDMPPEIGDTAEFLGGDEFGLVQGKGIIMRLFKNGNAVIQMNGRPFRTHFYYVLARA